MIIVDELFESLDDYVESKRPGAAIRVAYKAVSIFTAPLRGTFAYIIGGSEGGIESIFRNFAITSSIRRIASEMSEELTDFREMSYDVEESGRISALLSSHATMVYGVALEMMGIAEGQDINVLGFCSGVLLAVNIYDAANEARKYFGRRRGAGREARRNRNI